MIDTSSAKTTAKANSWDVLCNIKSEIQGTSEAEIEKKLRLTINTLFKVLTNI
jgi:Mor family transcriptional regulator